MYLPEPGHIAAAVNVGAAVVKNKNPLSQLIKRTWNTWIRSSSGREHVLIAGVGGSGKTTLLKFLTGKPDMASPKYQQTNVIESGSLVSAVFGTIWCLPGQDDPFSMGSSSPSSVFVSAKIKQTTGIVLVCSFGFNSVYLAGKGDDAEKIRESMLQREAHIFDSLGKVCGQFDRLRWIVVALNKRDIWLSDEAACLAHYDEAISRLRDQLSASGRGGNVQIIRKSVSLISSNVRRADGSVLHHINPEYDDAVRQQDVEDFLRTTSEVSSARL